MSLPLIFGGCATAGSTVSILDTQSSEIQWQLNSEKRKTQQLKREKQQLDQQIAALKIREKQLQQNPSSGSPGELADIQRAVAQLEIKRSSFGEIAEAVKHR